MSVYVAESGGDPPSKYQANGTHRKASDARVRLLTLVGVDSLGLVVYRKCLYCGEYILPMLLYLFSVCETWPDSVLYRCLQLPAHGSQQIGRRGWWSTPGQCGALSTLVNAGGRSLGRADFGTGKSEHEREGTFKVSRLGWIYMVHTIKRKQARRTMRSFGRRKGKKVT